jgi:hypothetical protein
MVFITMVRCSMCDLLYADWQGHTENECKRRLKFQVEKLKERLRRREKEDSAR